MISEESKERIANETDALLFSAKALIRTARVKAQVVKDFDTAERCTAALEAITPPDTTTTVSEECFVTVYGPPSPKEDKPEPPVSIGSPGWRGFKTAVDRAIGKEAEEV